MKRRFLSATCVASLAIFWALGLGTEPARGQGAAPRPAPTGVAIIDLSYIFKNHQRFQAQLEEMKRDVEAKEGELRQYREGVRQLTEQIKQYNPGTANYKQLEEQITKRGGELQIQVQLQKKEFLTREAKIYYETYREILNSVKFYCERQNIAVVLRFNGDSAENAEPDQVMKELNKSVLYNHPAVDITPVILTQLNSMPPQQAQRPAAGQPGVMANPPRR